jgi:hypothetical protein
LMKIRNGGWQVMTYTDPKGIVTFPSYHAAGDPGCLPRAPCSLGAGGVRFANAVVIVAAEARGHYLRIIRRRRRRVFPSPWCVSNRRQARLVKPVRRLTGSTPARRRHRRNCGWRPGPELLGVLPTAGFPGRTSGCNRVAFGRRDRYYAAFARRGIRPGLILSPHRTETGEVPDCASPGVSGENVSIRSRPPFWPPAAPGRRR